VLRVVKGDERGGREIIQEQAETVNRVFSEFATGMSPNQIAHGLNNGYMTNDVFGYHKHINDYFDRNSPNL
jgi:DNA invertase Pin-like site-specific DNA recombinase